MPKRYPVYDDYDREPRRRSYGDRDRDEKGGFLGLSWLTWGLILGGLVLFFIIVSALRGGGGVEEDSLQDIFLADYVNLIEQRPELIPYLEMYNFIVLSREEGFREEDILVRLELAGFTDREIERAFSLTTPYVSFIIEAENQNWTRQEIVEYLLEQEVLPQDIIEAYEVLGSFKTRGFGDIFRSYWPLFLLGGVVIYFVMKNSGLDDKVKLSPKVYTLDECEEYAREYLEKKGKSFIPSSKYRNRPDIRQYRFVYEEPLYPEFNDHTGSGFKVARRKLFLLAISYDCEVIDYLETFDDNRVEPFLFGAPKGFEQAGSKEYMGLRARSEQPIPEKGDRRDGSLSGSDSDDLLDFGGYSGRYGGGYSARYSPYRRRTSSSRYRPVNRGWED